MSRRAQSRAMRAFWDRLRRDDPRRFEEIKARRRATWAAKRAAKATAGEGRRKAVVVNEAETGETR